MCLAQTLYTITFQKNLFGNSHNTLRSFFSVEKDYDEPDYQNISFCNPRLFHALNYSLYNTGPAAPYSGHGNIY